MTFQFRCCGINDKDEYASSRWREEALGGADLIYPLTCCALSNTNDPEAYLNPVVNDTKKCMSDDIRIYGRHRHPQGCLEPILDWSTLEFVVIIAVSIGCSLVEIMSVCVSVYLLKHLGRRSKLLDS